MYIMIISEGEFASLAKKLICTVVLEVIVQKTDLN
jgi:hypothetical protein